MGGPPCRQRAEPARPAARGAAQSWPRGPWSCSFAKDFDWTVRPAACGALPACRERCSPGLAARAVEPLAEFAEDSSEGVLCQAACKALPACRERKDLELAARAMVLLAEPTKDYDCHVRVAECDVLVAWRGSELAARAVEMLAGFAKDFCAAACAALPACCESGGLELAGRALQLLSKFSMTSNEDVLRQAAREALPAGCECGELLVELSTVSD